ncbi:MAG TPA: hypothetical protein VJ904_13475, partial [Tichowtungia sp.]|nr:hypothetical protein [Tichowtungia sp.]
PSSEVSATPAAYSGGGATTVTFGSNNDGLGGFTQSTGHPDSNWSTLANSVQIAQTNGTENTSLLKEYSLDTSAGNSYTFEGTVGIVSSGCDNNVRVGFYLFGDSSVIPNEDEAGAIGMPFNMDDGGPENNSNADDDIGFRVGIDNTALSAEVERNQTSTPICGNLQGTDIRFVVDIAYVGTDIQIDAKLIEADSTETVIPTLTVAAADYTGDWFGFCTRARAAAGVDFVMDFKNITFTDHNGGVDTNEPAVPSGLSAEGGDGSVSLSWNNNAESDFDSYSVYRSTTSDSYGDALTNGLTVNSFVDDAVTNGVTYYYVVTASDTNSNRSAFSGEVSVVPGALTGYDLWATEWGTDIGVATNDLDADGINNFSEYALDGNPTNTLDQGTHPFLLRSGNGFLFVHPQRSDDTGIIYRVEVTTNLISGIWTNEGCVAIGTNVTGAALNFVTNDVGPVEENRFIRLQIGQ